MTAPQQYSPDPHRWRSLAVCLTAGFMTLLDVSIVNVALPSMQTGLGASASDLSWVVSGYALTFGLVLVPAGRLGDDRGRKTMFQLGLFLFTATSALCGIAMNPTWLVIARLLQGAACGLLNPQVIGIIQQLFRGPERGRAFGMFGAVVGISTAIGPLVGGLLLQWAGTTDGWRWVFYVNVPIGIVALLAGMWLLPSSRGAGESRSLDLVGVALLGLGVVLAMLPLIEAEQGASTAHWWLLAVGIALLALFGLWERAYRARGRHPLVNLALFSDRGYTIGTGIGLLYFGGFTGVFLVITLFLQRGLHYSPLQSGATMLSFAIGSALAAEVGGRLVFRFGHALIVVGMIAVLFGLTATALLVQHWTGGHIGLILLGPMLLAGIGTGLVISPNQTLTLNDVPPNEGGTAAAVLQTGQRIGTAIGTALAGSLFFGELTSSRGEFHVATALGLYGSTAVVGIALIVGIVDLVLAHRAKIGASDKSESGDGAVRGVIRGAVGKGVPGARIALLDTAGTVTHMSTTDIEGAYALRGVPAGDYTLVASGHLPVRSTLRIEQGIDLVHDVLLD